MWPYPVAHLHWPITRSYPIKTWPPSSNTSPLAHRKVVPHKNWPPSSGTSLLAYHEATPLKNVTPSSGTSPLAYHEADYPNGIFTDSELEANDSSWGSFDRWGDFSFPAAIYALVWSTWLTIFFRRCSIRKFGRWWHLSDVLLLLLLRRAWFFLNTD